MGERTWRRRLRAVGEDGFTLIEVIVVVQVLSILTMLATPSYLGFRDVANSKAASADVTSAFWVAEHYWSDPAKGNYTYKDMTQPALAAIDNSIKIDGVVVSTDFSTYCLEKQVGGFTSIAIRGRRATNSGLAQEDVPAGCPASDAL